MCCIVCKQLCFFHVQSHFLSVTVGNVLIFYRSCLDTPKEWEESRDVCSNFRQERINTYLHLNLVI